MKVSHFCNTRNRFSRRSVVFTVASMGLALRLPAMEPKAARIRGNDRGKSLITLWLSGGPSQLETWDPHPGTSIGGPTRDISTAIGGVRIAEHFPLVAGLLDRFSIIRSLVSKEGDHERGTHLLKTGYRPDPTLMHPSLGAIVAHRIPSESLEIPSFITLGSDNFPSTAGYLGAALDPYRVFVPGLSGQNLVANVDAIRQQRRLDALDRMTHSFEQGRMESVRRTLHSHTLKEALTLMSSEQLGAFSTAEEPLAVREAYGDNPFGRGCLVARRLVETGVRSIEVSLSGFDTHANNFDGHASQAAILDPALATLVGELEQRDLLNSTVLLVIGEFGRTPSINPLAGRDHWPHGFSCLVAGSGFVRGKVIGSTDPEGIQKMPVDPVNVADLAATVLDRLGIDFSHEVTTPVGRPMKLSEGFPVKSLCFDS